MINLLCHYFEKITILQKSMNNFKKNQPFLPLVKTGSLINEKFRSLLKNEQEHKKIFLKDFLEKSQSVPRLIFFEKKFHKKQKSSFGKN